MISRTLFVATLSLSVSAFAQGKGPDLPGEKAGEGGNPFGTVASGVSSNLYMGTAGTSISIAVPPGRLNMTPKVELNYSSSAGAGAYGFGWDLELGRITRSLKNGVPTYTDTDSFVLELNGQQIDLIHQSGKIYLARYHGKSFQIGFDPSQNYWKVIDKNGTAFFFGTNAAETQSRVGKFVQGSGVAPTPNTTLTWHLSQAVDNFGNQIDYRYVLSQGQALPTSIAYGGNIYPALNLDHAFEVAFTWDSSLDQAGRYPAELRTSYSAGIAQRNVRLLTSIQTFVNGEIARSYDFEMSQDPDRNGPGPRDPAGNYFLVGAELRAFAEDTANDVEVPASTFAYAPAHRMSFGSTPDITIPSPGPLHDRGEDVFFEVMDINGDGVPDHVDTRSSTPQVRLGTGSGFLAARPWAWPSSSVVGISTLRKIRGTDIGGDVLLSVFDIDGDGLPELVHASGSNSWSVYENTGNGFATTATPWPAPHSRITEIHDGGPVSSQTMDMNGDGRPDFIEITHSVDPSSGRFIWHVYLNEGRGFAAQPIAWLSPREYINSTAIAWHAYTNDYFDATDFQNYGLQDMNGDGLPDLVDSPHTTPSVRYDVDNYLTVWLNNGGGFSDATQWFIDGDVADLLPVAIGDDYKWPYPGPMSLTDSHEENASSDTRLLDLNGDGLVDLVRARQAANTPHAATCGVSRCFYVLLNTGAGFAAPIAVPAWTPEIIGGIPSLEIYSEKADWPDHIPGGEVHLLDFDGDGLVDVVKRVKVGTTHQWQIFLHPASPDSDSTYVLDRTKPGLLVSMMNGFGGVTMLDYASITLDGGAPCGTTSDVQTEQCIPFGHWVLTRSTDLNTAGPLSTTEQRYAYRGGFYSGDARELRGFARAWHFSADGRSTAQDFLQDSACRGQVAAQYQLGNTGCATPNIDADNTPCSPMRLKFGTTNNSWSCNVTELEGVILEQVVSTPYRRNSGGTHVAAAALARTTTYEYDDYSNETKRTVSAQLGGTVVTETRFDKKSDGLSSGMPYQFMVSRPSFTRTYAGNAPDRSLHEQTFQYGGKWELKRSTVCKALPGQACERIATLYGKYVAGLPQLEKTPLGGKKVTTYDALLLYPERTTSPEGLTAQFRYDYRHGKSTATKDASGQWSRTAHDGLGRPVASAGPLFVNSDGTAFSGTPETQFTYFAPIVTGLFGSPGYVEETHYYQARLGAVVTFHDSYGRILGKKYRTKTLGGPEFVVSDLSVLNDEGLVTQASVPCEATTMSLHQLTEAGAGSCPMSQVTYDPISRAQTETLLPDGQRIKRVTSIPGVSMEMNARGLIAIELRDGLGRTFSKQTCFNDGTFPGVADIAMTADAVATANAVAAICADLQARTDFEYDGLDRMTKLWLVNADNAAQRFLQVRNTYDTAGHLVEVDELDSGLWQHDYNALGQVTATTTPRGDRITKRYDREGRITSQTLENVTTSSRQTTQYEYMTLSDGIHGIGKLKEVTTEGPDNVVSRSYQYDVRGRVVAEKATLRTRTGTSTSREDSFEVQTFYDLADRAIVIKYPKADGGTEDATTVYDIDWGVPVRTRIGTQEIVSRVESNLLGKTVYVEYSNGTADHLQYAPLENNGLLTCQRTTSPGHEATPTLSTGACSYSAANDYAARQILTRNENGQITRIDDLKSGNSAAHSAHMRVTYDTLGRVTRADYPGAKFDAYIYNSLGNIVGRTKEGVGMGYAYDPVQIHHPTAFAGQPVTHDANGNRISKGVTSYLYDGMGRLTEAADNDQTALHYYGADRQRVARYDQAEDSLTHYLFPFLEVASNGSGAVVSRHFFLGEQRVATDSFAISGSLRAASVGMTTLPNLPWPWIFAVAAFMTLLSLLRVAITAGLKPAFISTLAIAVGCNNIQVGPADDPSAHMLPAAEGLRFYHIDHLGSTTLVTDALGAVVEHIRYRAYGEIRGLFNASFASKGSQASDRASDFGFTGQRTERGLDLLYYNSRFYDPEMGLFLQLDPKREFASPYAYVGYDPINANDPTGEGFWLVAIAIAAVMAAATFVDTLVRTGDLGAAFKAGVMSFAIGVATAGLTYGALQTGVGQLAAKALNTAAGKALAVGAAGFNAVQSFKDGNIATGIATLGVAAYGLATSARQARNDVRAMSTSADGAMCDMQYGEDPSWNPENWRIDGTPEAAQDQINDVNLNNPEFHERMRYHHTHANSVGIEEGSWATPTDMYAAPAKSADATGLTFPRMPSGTTYDWHAHTDLLPGHKPFLGPSSTDIRGAIDVGHPGYIATRGGIVKVTPTGHWYSTPYMQ